MKQETTEEAAKNYNLNTINAFGDYESFIAGAKWQQERSYSEKQMDDAYDKGFKDAIERSYSEEEVRLILRELNTDLYEIYPLESLEEWFEQFKKK